MPIPTNPKLYAKVTAYAKQVYKKHSAYRSGFIVKTYKDMGGTYREDHKTRKLKQWYKERWMDVGHKKYPVYRPTVRVNKTTPLTLSEIDSTNLKKQIILKQKYKGDKNLPPFINTFYSIKK